MLQANHVFSAADTLEIDQASASIVDDQQIDETSIEANTSITATASIDQPTVMQHLTQPWQDVLFENLRNLRRAGKLCDVSLITKNARGEDATFMAHSVILVAASPYLSQELDKAGICDSAVGLNMVHVPEPGVGPVLDLLYGTIVTIRDPDHFHDVKLAASLLGVLNLHNFLQTVEGDDVSRYPIRLQHHKVLSYGPSRRGWVPQKSISKACQTESAGAKASDLHIEEYVYHKKQDFNSEVKCPYCSIFFTNKIVYLSHLSRIHPTSKGEFWFTCDTCKEAFLSCSQYKQHLEIHPVNNVTVVSSVKKTAKTGSFLCQECGKICLSSYRLNQHMRIHAQKTAKQKVACPVCDLKFNNQADVEEHVVSQHSDPNDNICELCSKVFSTKRMLKSHKMFAHAVSALTMHYCQFCDEGFDETSALREHLKVHSTKRIKKEAAPLAPVLEEAPPIPMNNCQFCQKAFRKPFQLRNHEKKCRLKPVVTQEDVGEGNQRAIHIELPLNYMASDVPITIELPEGMELPPEIVLPSGENPETLHEVEEQMVNVQVKTE